MDLKIRMAQKQVLKVFSASAKSFALAGGTALELYYLQHRSSLDLDFFSPEYGYAEIDKIISAIAESGIGRPRMQAEFLAPSHAKVRFYAVPVKGSNRPLKIDFVEDVVFNQPVVKRICGVRVYSVENIYLQKVIAITGMGLKEDDAGRQVTQGRREARDAFDIYMLSKKITPLSIFLKKQPGYIKRGITHWYQTFSRQDLKLGLMDLDIYDKKFDAVEMIAYLDNQIKEFIKELLP